MRDEVHEEEMEQLFKLLLKYSDIFATDDFNLGCFTKILYSIDTGDTPSITQKMRRTFLGFENEEEKHSEKMLI